MLRCLTIEVRHNYKCVLGIASGGIEHFLERTIVSTGNLRRWGIANGWCGLGRRAPPAFLFPAPRLLYSM